MYHCHYKVAKKRRIEMQNEQGFKQPQEGESWAEYELRMKREKDLAEKKAAAEQIAKDKELKALKAAARRKLAEKKRQRRKPRPKMRKPVEVPEPKVPPKEENGGDLADGALL